ncbi:MAG: aspartate kinase, partial [Clostridiales bacterium]|nr:aspartate kinase [Clostridiales bacterium]
MLFVEKFGGSSLAGVERVRCAARLIADMVRAGHSVAAVLSAQGKTTDALLSTAAHYSRSPSKRELDMLLATGEQASVALMAMTLEEMGLPAVSLTGWQAGVGTDETYGDAHIRRLSMERVRRELDEGKVVLIAGFQGVSPGNDI